METKYLIVGNSAGGIAAAEAIREIDSEGSLTIVSEEPYPAYSRPLLLKYLTSERTLEGILFRPRDFYERHSICFLSGKTAVAVDLQERRVHLNNGESIGWDKLLLAVGAKPIRPQVKGSDKKGIFALTSLDEAKAVGECLSKVRKAVIIGGGLIGVSVAEALARARIEVTMVVRTRILRGIVDEEVSSIIEEAMKRAGIEVITGHTLAEINGGEKVEAVTLNDGDRIACQLLVAAMGMSPRLELALSGKLHVNRGIVVNEYMVTDHHDVYACGDVVEAYDFAHEDYRLNPAWPNAYVGGRTAGYNMTGNRLRYPGGTAVNSFNYFGIGLIAAGVTMPPQGNGFEILTHREGEIYQKLMLKEGLVKGMILVGAIEKAGIFFSLMREKVNVESFKESLLDHNFGLASLPRTLWEERLKVSPALFC